MSCNHSGNGSSTTKKPSITPVVNPSNQEKTPEETNANTIEVAEENKTFALQVTALNFLQGGREPCDVKNKIYLVNTQDVSVKIIVCRNSKVELSMQSNLGTITYRAVDLATGEDLPSTYTGTSEFYELGKTQEMTRFYVENPYGFTYLMVEDVTGINQEDLAKFNQLNSRLSSLKAQVLTAQQNGEAVDPMIFDEMRKIEEEMSELSKKISENRKP